MAFELANAVVTGVLVGLYMAISVGPTLFAVLKYSLENSHKAGIAFILGVSLSDAMYVTIANLAASWLQVLNQYRWYIGIVGSLILIAAGLVGLLKKPKPVVLSGSIKAISGGRYLSIFSSGFLINTINPGVIISWLTAVSATANKDGVYRFVLFGTCLALVLSIDFLKVFLAGRIRLMMTPKAIVFIQKLSSGIIMGLGALLFISTVFPHFWTDVFSFFK